VTWRKDKPNIPRPAGNTFINKEPAAKVSRFHLPHYALSWCIDCADGNNVVHG